MSNDLAKSVAEFDLDILGSFSFKYCCCQDDQKAENDMAMKRAALLEKRLRRERETLLRKQQLEAELEHKKEETR